MEKKFVGQEYMAATNGKGLHQESPEHRIAGRLTITFSTIITLLSVFIVAFCLAFQLCPIDGKSMMKTLNASGDNTDSALTCTVGTPHRGDIIVMKLYIQDSHRRDVYLAAQGDKDALNRLRTTTPGYTVQDAKQKLQSFITNEKYEESDSQGYYKLIVKRLIAVGGDYLSMRLVDGQYYLYLNGEQLDESYLDTEEVGRHDAKNFKQLWSILHTPNNSENDVDDWVNTDWNDLLERNTDTDSTASAFQLKIPEHYYFVMGDNRGGNTTTHLYSWDSTYLGPLPTTSYYSSCVDVISNKLSMPEYLWQKFVYYVCFGWAWQK